jgi:hypothetical protein
LEAFWIIKSLDKALPRRAQAGRREPARDYDRVCHDGAPLLPHQVVGEHVAEGPGGEKRVESKSIYGNASENAGKTQTQTQVEIGFGVGVGVKRKSPRRTRRELDDMLEGVLQAPRQNSWVDAVVTLLATLVFGLGWTLVELERAEPPLNRYDSAEADRSELWMAAAATSVDARASRVRLSPSYGTGRDWLAEDGGTGVAAATWQRRYEVGDKTRDDKRDEDPGWTVWAQQRSRR